MAKTLRNRRRRATRSRRSTRRQRGGLLGMSSTIQKMRSFDKADFKTVYDYLANTPNVHEYGWLPSVTNENIYDFAHFKAIYMELRELASEPDMEQVEYNHLNDSLANFKRIVKHVYDKKMGAKSQNNRPTTM